MPGPTALLFVQSTYHDESDRDSIPPAVPLDGVVAVSRYSASDDKSPDCLAVYELSETSPLISSGSSGAQQSSVGGRTGSASAEDWRVYRLISDKSSPTYASYVAECKAGSKTRDLLHVSLQPRPGGEVNERDFNDWYEEEHIPLHAYAPGWLRSSRWEFVSFVAHEQHGNGVDATVSAGDSGTARQVAKYLVVHEFEDIRLVGSNQLFIASLSTDWRDEVMANVDKDTEERRSWKLSFQR